MISRRAVLVMALLGVVHTLLRVSAAVLGAPWSFVNYLKPFRLRPLDGWIIAELAGIAAVILLTTFVVYTSWRKPARAPAMWSSALGAALSGVCLGVIAVYSSTVVERSYGWVLFVVVPFLVGFQAALALGYQRAISLWDAVLVSLGALAILGGALLAAAIEGAICLAMALPIAIPLAVLGGVAGFMLRRNAAAHSSITFLLLIGLVPYGATVERAILHRPDSYTVTTSIDIAASPQRVWRTVLEPAQLTAPSEILFRAGIAYPLASHIEGAGLEATRYCDFSTGKLVEPVMIWDENHRLRFRVASNPLPMQEWTPYARLHPPHLDGFLVSRQGEFRLEPLPDGGTRLVATTWYQDRLYPGQYWRQWSDYIIHQVHRMVLINVRERALQTR